jgi:hypothetical protein
MIQLWSFIYRMSNGQEYNSLLAYDSMNYAMEDCLRLSSMKPFELEWLKVFPKKGS